MSYANIRIEDSAYRVLRHVVVHAANMLKDVGAEPSDAFVEMLSAIYAAKADAPTVGFRLHEFKPTCPGATLCALCGVDHRGTVADAEGGAAQ